MRKINQAIVRLGRPMRFSVDALFSLTMACVLIFCSHRFSSADFGMGQTLESLLAQLAELHQTREQPTSVAFRESLPRLKVAAADSPVSASPVTAADQPATAADQSASRPEGVACCRAGDTCCVCRNEFTEGTEVVQLPCDHCFDEACIMPWLEMVRPAPSSFCNMFPRLPQSSRVGCILQTLVVEVVGCHGVY